jgi:TPR repeat protein
MADDRLHRAYAAAKARRYGEALKAYSELAASGSPNAWASLGHMHEFGLAVPKDFVEAERCYRKAIELGDVDASHRLARLLIEKNDYEGAFTLFSAAAAKGYLPSVYWLGASYLEGKGTDRDVKKAELYLKQAADRGHVFARGTIISLGFAERSESESCFRVVSAGCWPYSLVFGS